VPCIQSRCRGDGWMANVVGNSRNAVTVGAAAAALGATVPRLMGFRFT
jgi:hypothetical protein